MSEPLEPKVERQVAVDLFNYVWTLLTKADRTQVEDDAMLHAAHASRHHWARVGGPENLARGEWQVSRVYCVLGRAEPALYHASRCLAICQEHHIADWDLAFAYEALARAAAVAGDSAARDRYLAAARAVDIKDSADRAQLDNDLETICARPTRGRSGAIP